MLKLLLLASLVWPSDCIQDGQMYHDVARIRDAGVSREEAASRAHSNKIKLAISHVYDRPDMTPQDWKQFATGVCVGARLTIQVNRSISGEITGLSRRPDGFDPRTVHQCSSHQSPL